MIKYLILSIVFLFIGNYSAIGQEVIATLDDTGKAVMNEELRKSSEGIRNNKSLISTLQTTVNNLETEFSITDGHTHDGNDSKKVDYNNLDNIPVISDKQKFTTSGTFTAPAGITTVYISAVGGGGGTGNYGSGGGGSGAYIISAGVSVTPDSNYTVTVGDGGGAGLYNTNGTNGTASSFVGDNVTITCNGGSAADVATGGVGGTVTSGLPTAASGSIGLGGKASSIAGDNGADGDGTYGGGGAGNPFGVGGNGGSYGPCSSGGTGTGFGAGAGGAGNGCNGTAGRPGVVIIEW